MPKLLKKIQENTIISLLTLCPECDYPANIHDNGDSFNVECSACGVTGYRYETEKLAVRDFRNHYVVPKLKKTKGAT